MYPKELKILQEPDHFLRLISKEVSVFSKDLKDFVLNMFSLIEKRGIGLAAPQVGVSQRIFIIKINEFKEVFINPKITKATSEMIAVEEGCLSVEGFKLEIPRHHTIQVEYQDLKGNKKEKNLTGMASICFQHELDHLNGILIIDKE